jgi:dUTPase
MLFKNAWCLVPRSTGYGATTPPYGWYPCRLFRSTQWGKSLKQALVNMLTMQNSMNTRVHPDWINQNFEWYRATWMECGELIDHYGYKWWKKQVPDMEQVQLEVIDIWHFGLSALFTEGRSIEQIADAILAELESHQPDGKGVREATELLALHALQTKGFSAAHFWDLMLASGLDFDSLYSAYVGKNVLNFFRQDNGYKEGTYIKNWQGREDNEHLVELVASLDKAADDFSDRVYKALAARYAEVTAS